MLLGELWWAYSAGAIPGNPLRAFVSVAVAMFLDASGFHAGSFAPALSSRKVHPVYRLQYFEDGANDTFSISDLTSIFVEPFTVIVACLYLYFNFECLCWF